MVGIDPAFRSIGRRGDIMVRGATGWGASAPLLSVVPNGDASIAGAKKLTIGDGTAASFVVLNGPVSPGSTFQLKVSSVLRWVWGLDAVAETGSDAGSGWVLRARTDSGGAIDNPISIARASGGTITIVRPISQTGSTTFSTGTGSVSLNGHTSIASGKDLVIGNAYVGTPQSPTGYIIIKDSTGTSYKVSCNA